MRDLNLLDFADMELYARQLLQQHPDVLAGLQQATQYIMVDEFQDCSKLQVRYGTGWSPVDYTALSSLQTILLCVIMCQGSGVGAPLTLACVSTAVADVSLLECCLTLSRFQD